MTTLDRVQPSVQLRETGVVAIFRASTADRFGEIGEVLVEAGITCMEVTLTTPDALAAIREMKARLPATVDIGAGTVTTADEVYAAVEAGARFVVSPATDPDVLAAAAEAGVASLPGAFSPTEVLSAWRHGASAVKLFPASALTASYLKNLAGPFPEIPILPTGGVRIEDIGGWIRAGALGVGLGGPLFGDAVTGGDLEALAQRARSVVGEVAAARQSL